MGIFKRFSWRVAVLWLLGLLICGCFIWGGPLAKPAIADLPLPDAANSAVVDKVDTIVNLDAASSVYTYRDRPSSDGIGKVYLGREIAKVMGYEGAGWLERGRRESQEKPSVAIACAPMTWWLILALAPVISAPVLRRKCQRRGF